MYTVEEEIGVAKYGSKFKTAEYYLYKHLNGAGTSDCDHWHDGAGTMTVLYIYDFPYRIATTSAPTTTTTTTTTNYPFHLS